MLGAQRLAVNAEIHLYEGDSTKGNNGFMFAVTARRVYIQCSDTFATRDHAASSAAGVVDLVERYVDRDHKMRWTRVSLREIGRRMAKEVVR